MYVSVSMNVQFFMMIKQNYNQVGKQINLDKLKT